MSKRLEPAPGVLYVVGTPIGNLGDLSPRAKFLLQNVSAIACEDTRHSGYLLKTLGANAPLFSFHKHNATNRTPQLLDLLKNGESLALISDAGLPGISDPGESLVAATKQAGHDVICIPGPCAAITALVSSGLPCNQFCFEGFLPSKGKSREEILLRVSKENRTTIIYEAPHRLIRLLDELEGLCGEERSIQIAKELTKLHEQQIGSTIKEVREYFSVNKPIGEFTIVLAGATKEAVIPPSSEDLLEQMKVLMKAGASANEAAREIAKSSGLAKRILYSLLHNPPISNND